MNPSIIFAAIITLLYIMDSSYQQVQWKKHNQRRKEYWQRTRKRLKKPFNPNGIL